MRAVLLALVLALLGGCATEHPRMVCFPAVGRMKDGSETHALLCRPVTDDKVKFVGESSL